MLYKENTPTIETKRLILRKFNINDLNAVFELMSDVDVNTFLPCFAHETKEQSFKFMKSRFLDNYSNENGYKYAICLKEDNLPIGYVSLSYGDANDFGYALKKQFWNMGITYEATQAVVEKIKASGNYKFITATHDVNNPNSGKVMKKLGMIYKYTYTERWQPKDITVKFRMYQLNFDENQNDTYMEYWDKYETHFIETENLIG